MPNASVSTATAVKPLYLSSIRMPKRKSWSISSSPRYDCIHSASQNALLLRRSRSSFYRKHAQSHCVEQLKDRGVGADAERERKDRHCGEAFVLEQHSHAKT